MRNGFGQLLIVAALALTMGSCSTYNKLIKSGDSEEMYKAAMNLYQEGKYTKSLQLFEEIAHKYQGTTREDTITYYSGCALYKQGDFETSELVFDEFRHRFGRSPFIEDAEYMYAMGFYFASPVAERDQTTTLKAISAISDYMGRYPNTLKKELCEQRIDELTNKLYEKEFINAKTYYKIGRYKAAVMALENALTKYPQTPYREQIMYLKVASAYELAHNSRRDLQTDRYIDMMDAYYSYVSEFPESQHTREVERMQKEAKKYLADKDIDREDMPQ